MASNELSNESNSRESEGLPGYIVGIDGLCMGYIWGSRPQVPPKRFTATLLTTYVKATDRWGAGVGKPQKTSQNSSKWVFPKRGPF